VGGTAAAARDGSSGVLAAQSKAGLIPSRYDDDTHNLLAALFGEEGHRWLLAVPPEKKGWLRTAALHFKAPLIPLGKTGGGRLKITAGEQVLIDAQMSELMALHREGLAKLLES
jgi:hypothetical protein